MWIPEWVLWLACGLPCLWIGGGLLLLMASLGQDADRNAKARTAEALEVLACSECRPLLPVGKCEKHRWHISPPPESMPRA